jgi:hypothetical protein
MKNHLQQSLLPSSGTEAPQGEGQDEGVLLINQLAHFDPLTPTLSLMGEGVCGTAMSSYLFIKRSYFHHVTSVAM